MKFRKPTVWRIGAGDAARAGQVHIIIIIIIISIANILLLSILYYHYYCSLLLLFYHYCYYYYYMPAFLLLLLLIITIVITIAIRITIVTMDKLDFLNAYDEQSSLSNRPVSRSLRFTGRTTIQVDANGAPMRQRGCAVFKLYAKLLYWNAEICIGHVLYAALVLYCAVMNLIV